MTYVVQPGDTLWAIAAHFGVSTQAVAATNRITNPHSIFVGQTLYIPTAGSEATLARQGNLEREFLQLVTIVENHSRQIAELDRRLRRLER